MSEQSVEAAARQRLEEEQEQEHAAKLAAYEREIAAERETEEREQEAEAARAAAREEAERLSFERRVLEDQVEREIEGLAVSLRELEELDRLHRNALQAAGYPIPSVFLRSTVAHWFGARLGPFSGTASSDTSARTLAERDPLTPNP